jgi:hypothetical protein
VIVPLQYAGDRLALRRPNSDLLPQKLGDELGDDAFVFSSVGSPSAIYFASSAQGILMDRSNI